MTALSFPFDTKVHIAYGAADLKKYLGRFTFRGFIFTITLLVIVLFCYIYFGTNDIAVKTQLIPPTTPIPNDGLIYNDPFPNPVPPPNNKPLNPGLTSKAGVPIATPDVFLNDDIGDFATDDEIYKALPTAGDGSSPINEYGQNRIIVDNPKVNKEVEPAYNEIFSGEKEPQVDLAKLQTKMIYPEIARQAGIEGKVVIRILVGKDGKVSKDRIIVDYTDSALLNEAAINAIADYGTFTPAIQNGQPVACWVSIPLTFRLK